MQKKIQVDVFYVSNINRINSSVFSSLVNGLPIKIQNKIKSFRRWQDSQACMIGNLLLKKYVLNASDFTMENLTTNLYGKPYLPNGIFFNISHTDGAVLLAISELEIGIDVELVKPLDFYSILDKIANDDAINLIKCAHNSLIAFYNYWTKKEATLKQIGIGLSSSLNSFEISDDDTVNLDGERLKLIKIDFANDNYIAHIAIPDTDTNNLSINVHSTEIWSN